MGNNIFVEGHAHFEDHEHNHHEHEHRHDCPYMKNSNNKDIEEIWDHALQSVFIITFLGNAVIFVFLFLKLSKNMLNLLCCFAVGGLLGDVFLHLIPHTIGAAAESEQLPVYILAGIISFFLLEKLLSLLSPHSHSHEDKRGAERTFTPAVVLNLVADFAHNFTDGLALAAAFKVGKNVGTNMTLAVTLHEIPHELGDFAVLISNGISNRKAIALQFLSAAGALLGCLVGLSSEINPEKIIAFTAGSFLYVSLATLIPDITKIESSNSTLWKAFESLIQTLFIIFGVYSMFLIEQLEGENHGHSHVEGHEHHHNYQKEKEEL